ncbi:MAG: YdcF family protein [Chloroflexota bacterium]|jgi:uncharacterized SAM-binding protein YcdF (DUF218 family)|nr:YdcF family protein [Chloroflexota bacterium]
MKLKKLTPLWWLWIFVIPLLCLFSYIVLVGIGGVLIVADPIQEVDAVVVLSGDDGDRLALAIEMHERRLAPNLVITNVEDTVNQRLAAEAQAGGFAKNEIYITKLEVESTLDEALAVRELALQKGWTTLMVVTDPFHSFRARFIFRRELRGSGIKIAVHPVVGHWFRSPSWFFHAEGWQFVFLEITKLLSYLLSITFK